MQQPRIPELGRFAEPALLILVSLSDGPKHGYAIMADVEAGTGRPMGPGTLYAALARLEERGLIEALPPVDRRRPYRLTGLGEHRARRAAPRPRRVRGTRAAAAGRVVGLTRCVPPPAPRPRSTRRAGAPATGTSSLAVLEERPLGPFDVADVLLGALDAHLHLRGLGAAPNTGRGLP